jgi:hypothetical protein
MKRLIAALSFAVIALPAAAIEHGGPWEVNETRAPWYQKSAPESDDKPARETQQR